MTQPLLKIAHTPPTSVSPRTTVREAVRMMVEARVGAVAVVENGILVGIFTERDLMKRVVGEDRDPGATVVREVMVNGPVEVSADTARSRALELMVQNHFRHLPITDGKGKVLGMLSIRNLLRHQLTRLTDDVRAMEQYMAADGPGG